MLPGNNVPVDSKTDENSPTHDIENETTLASTPHKKRRIENLNDDDTKDEKKEDVTQALISHKEQKIDNASQDEIKDTPWYFCKSNHFPKPVKTIAELSYDLQKDILLNSEKYLSEDDTVDDANVTLWFWDSFILSPWEKQQQYTLNINNDQINELIDAGVDVSTDIDDHGNMLADALLFTHDSNGKKFIDNPEHFEFLLQHVIKNNIDALTRPGRSEMDGWLSPLYICCTLENEKLLEIFSKHILNVSQQFLLDYNLHLLNENDSIESYLEKNRQTQAIILESLPSREYMAYFIENNIIGNRSAPMQ